MRPFTFTEVDFQPGEGWATRGGDGASGQLGGWPVAHTGPSLHPVGARCSEGSGRSPSSPVSGLGERVGGDRGKAPPVLRKTPSHWLGHA